MDWCGEIPTIGNLLGKSGMDVALVRALYTKYCDKGWLFSSRHQKVANEAMSGLVALS